MEKTATTYLTRQEEASLEVALAGPSPDLMLDLPWGRVHCLDALSSPRAQVYFRWLMKKTFGARLKYIDRLTGKEQYKPAIQYPLEQRVRFRRARRRRKLIGETECQY